MDNLFLGFFDQFLFMLSHSKMENARYNFKNAKMQNATCKLFEIHFINIFLSILDSFPVYLFIQFQF